MSLVHFVAAVAAGLQRKTQYVQLCATLRVIRAESLRDWLAESLMSRASRHLIAIAAYMPAINGWLEQAKPSRVSAIGRYWDPDTVSARAIDWNVSAACVSITLLQLWWVRSACKRLARCQRIRDAVVSQRADVRFILNLKSKAQRQLDSS